MNELLVLYYSKSGSVKEMALLIGNKTSDNKGYYALWASDQFFRPVIIVDSNWVETLLDVFNQEL